MKKILFLWMGVLVTFCVLAQDSVQARKYINALASNAMRGRGYAYKGDSIAAQYIREQFKRMDIPPFQFSDYYHRYNFPVYAMEGPVMAKVGEKTLVPWVDYAIAPNAHSAHKDYHLIVMTPEELLDPQCRKQCMKKYHKRLLQSLVYVDLTTCEHQETKKEVNRILYSLSSFDTLFPVAGFLVGVNDMPVWTFSRAHEVCDYVIAYIKPSCLEKKSKIYLSYDNVLRDHATQNVCAMIKGYGAPDTIVMVGGHYDHLGQMGDALVFPGAHDNASGTATVLDIAQYFKNHPPYYTMIFTLFSGEEAGLKGSFAFVKDSLFDYSKLKMMLNIDLMGGGDDGFTVVNADGENTAFFFQSMERINQRDHWVKTIRSRKNALNSDHAPFVLKGMPAVFVYVLGGHTGGYHQPDDTAENCSLTGYNNIVKLFIKALEEL